MVEDAKARLAAMGYELADKIFINGYSASGSFANRFTLLHPEIIRAAASGSPGGWPTVPVSTWAGETLNYPVGVADLASLVGEPFDLAAFRRVPQYLYVGDQDNNDAVDYADGFDEADREQIDRLFGDGSPYIVERWPHAEAIFDSVQSRAKFVIYPGVGHSLTGEMFEDLLDFYRQYHPGQFELSRAIQALQVLAGIDGQEMPEMVDINGDGRIGMEEAIYTLRELAGLM
jgi:pimeloyl-ACP methyl ester carboxylesterase